MRYPQYENGKLIGHYSQEQKNKLGVVYTSEPIADDHPDILQWNEDRKPKPQVGKSLADRVAALEEKLSKVKV